MPYGQDSNIGISFQDSYGSSLVDSVYFLPHLTDGVKLEIPPLIDEAMKGIYDEGESYEGPKMVAGDFETTAQAISLGVMLRAMMGAPSTVNSDGLYTHTFKPRIADFDEKCANDPVTYYRYLQTGSAELLYDLNASTLELAIANGELMKAKIGFVGGSFEQLADIAAAYPVGKKFAWDVTSVSIGGAGKDEMMDLTITIDDQLEAQHTLSGSKYPARIKRTGMRTVAVAGTLKFDNQDEYQQFISQSERALIVNFKGITEVQSGYYEEIKIELPAMRYSDVPVAAGGPGPLEISFTGAGKYKVTSATALQITLTNTQAAY